MRTNVHLVGLSHVYTCKSLLLHPITLSNTRGAQARTHTHTLSLSLSVELPVQGIGPLRRPFPVQHTKFTRHKYPCPRRDPNPHFKQENGGTPTP